MRIFHPSQFGHYEWLVADTTLLMNREPDPYRPIKAMMNRICEAGGKAYFWLVEDGSDKDTVARDNPVEVLELPFTAIGGCFSARATETGEIDADLVFVTDAIEKLNNEDVNWAIDSDRWIVLWNESAPPWVEARVELESKRGVLDVEVHVLQQLVLHNDLLLMGYHDANPLRYFVNDIALNLFEESVRAGHEVLGQSQWVKDNFAGLVWNEEYLTFDEPSRSP